MNQKYRNNEAKTFSTGGFTTTPKLPLREGENVQQSNNNNNNNNMTPYEGAQFRAADCMWNIREMITQLDEMTPDVSRRTRVELSQRIRKRERQAKVEMQEAKKLAISERRQQEFELLSNHFKDTLNMVRARYGGGLPTSNMNNNNNNNNNNNITEKISNNFTDAYGTVSNSAQLSIESGNITPDSNNGYNIRDDAEFTQFFLSTQKNDVVIDAALDRIYSGVQRLNDNATLITSELKVQEKILDGTEEKIDNTHDKLSKLNIKLKKAIKRMDRPMCIIYLICLLILIGIIVTIYFMTK